MKKSSRMLFFDIDNSIIEISSIRVRVSYLPSKFFESSFKLALLSSIDAILKSRSSADQRDDDIDNQQKNDDDNDD